MLARRSVRLIIALGTALASLIAICLCYSNYANVSPTRVSGGQPALQIDPAARDFGSVLPGEELKATFRLTNAGDRELEVTNLRSSCGCAPAEIDRRRIGPGEEARVTVAFHAPAHVGTFSHLVSYTASDRSTAGDRDLSGSLLISGKAEWPVEASPRRIFAPTLRVGDDASYDLTLFNVDRSPLSLLAVSATDDRIRIERLGSGKHEQQLRVRISTAAAGRITGSVRFDTDNKRRPEVVVPVEATVVDDAAAVPQQLLLGSRPGAAAVTKAIVVTLPSPGDAVAGLSLASKDWDVREWTVTPINDRRSRVDVSLGVPSVPGYHRTVLEIRTAKSATPITVKVSCHVAADPAAADER